MRPGRRVMLCVSSPRAMTAMEEKLRGAGVVAYPYDGTLRADAVALAVNDGSRSLNGFELPRAGFVLMTDAEIGAGGKQKRVRAAKMKKASASRPMPTCRWGIWSSTPTTASAAMWGCKP